MISEEVVTAWPNNEYRQMYRAGSSMVEPFTHNEWEVGSIPTRPMGVTMHVEDVLNRCRRALRKHPEFGCFPHWTYLIAGRSRQILSVGLNRPQEPDRAHGYHWSGDSTYVPKWHAELDALLKLRERFEDFVAFNVRLNSRGEPRMARPCPVCYRLLKRWGCRKVYYTTNDGIGLTH